jgi:hypothetical protein
MHCLAGQLHPARRFDGQADQFLQGKWFLLFFSFHWLVPSFALLFAFPIPFENETLLPCCQPVNEYSDQEPDHQ